MLLHQSLSFVEPGFESQLRSALLSSGFRAAELPRVLKTVIVALALSNW